MRPRERVGAGDLHQKSFNKAAEEEEMLPAELLPAAHNGRFVFWFNVCD